MKIILVIFALFALSAIVEGQWAAAARGLYQPVILSIGAVFTAFNVKKKTKIIGEDINDDWEDWMNASWL